MVPRRYLRSILAARSGGVRRGPATGRRRPALEPLESRRLLSSIVEIPTPTPSSQPREIAVGPDGQLWFAEEGSGKIGSIDPNTHSIAEYTLSTTGADPWGITAGPDQKIWFTEPGASKIGSIDPFGRKFPGGGGILHALAEYAVPTPHSVPWGIAAAPDGMIWFTEQAADKIGSFDPATHAFHEYSLTAGSGPEGLVLGANGDLWFTEEQGNRIGSIDPVTDHIAEYTVPTPVCKPEGIAAGPDGKLWFVEFTGDKIGSIDPVTTEITEYPTSPGPTEIAAGPDGNLWCTLTENIVVGTSPETIGSIGWINPTTHKQGGFNIPTNGAAPFGIATGPEGNVWFTDSGGSAVGVVTPAQAIAVTDAPTEPVAPGEAFGLTVSVTYADGPVDTAFNGDVTLSLSDPSHAGATLGGTLTATASAGIARFTGLTLHGQGTYWIVASLSPDVPTASVEVTVDSPPGYGGPPVSGGSPKTGGSPPPVESPTIVAAAPLLAGKGRHRRLAGFTLDFSAAMDPARAADPAEYVLVQFRRRGRRLVSRPVGLRASYDAAARRVTLTLVGRAKFAAGGKMVVAGGAGGLDDASGTPLDGGGATFVIARKGKGLSR